MSEPKTYRFVKAVERYKLGKYEQGWRPRRKYGTTQYMFRVHLADNNNKEYTHNLIAEDVLEATKYAMIEAKRRDKLSAKQIELNKKRMEENKDLEPYIIVDIIRPDNAYIYFKYVTFSGVTKWICQYIPSITARPFETYNERAQAQVEKIKERVNKKLAEFKKDAERQKNKRK